MMLGAIIIIIATLGFFYGKSTEKILTKNFTRVYDTGSLVYKGDSNYKSPLEKAEKVYFSNLSLNNTVNKIKKLSSPDAYKEVSNEVTTLKYGSTVLVLQSGQYLDKLGTIIYMATEKVAYRRHSHYTSYWRSNIYLRSSSSHFKGGSYSSGK